MAQTETGYEVHTCKSGHCAVISFPEAMTTQLKSNGSGDWCEPIRVSVGVQEGVIITSAEIEAEIAEDSQIAIDEGLFTGEGKAYILANIFFFSPDDITNEGLPFVMNSVNAAFSTIDFNGNVGTIYDDHVLDNRSCYGSHKTIAIVANNTPGVQETSSNGLNPDEDFNPTEVFKLDAFLATNFRNHAITHSSGTNHPNHQFGPDLSKRPMQVGNDLSYGWSTTGFGGFSGGTNLGIGPDGEDLAGHIADGYATWLGLIPNLTAEIISVPSELDIDEDGIFEANINKDIGNENWQWTFTKGATTLSETSNPISISFSEAGTWSYEVIVTNDCEGQSDTLTGNFEVNTVLQAPVASCQDITVSLDTDGMATVVASEIDNGSTDIDGTIVTMEINNTNSLIFTCLEKGVNDITFTVIDNDGLSSSCMASVMVVDDMPPEISCVGDITLQLAAGQDTTLDVSNLIADVSDNCGVSATASQYEFSGDTPGTYSVTVTAVDDSGNESFCVVEVTVDQMTATINVANDNRISIFPNPTSDMVNIQIDGTLDVTQVVLFDLTGREISKSNFAPQISVEHVPQGIFLMALITADGNRFTERILKLNR